MSRPLAKTLSPHLRLQVLLKGQLIVLEVRLGSGAAFLRDLDSCLLAAGQQTLFSMADQVRSWPATAFGIPHDSLIQTTPVFFRPPVRNSCRFVSFRQRPKKP